MCIFHLEAKRSIARAAQRMSSLLTCDTQTVNLAIRESCSQPSPGNLTTSTSQHHFQALQSTNAHPDHDMFLILFDVIELNNSQTFQ